MRRLQSLLAAAALGLHALVPSIAPGQTDLESWSEMSRRIVSARQLIGSDATNGVTPMGMIRDIMLTPDRGRVEYLLVEVPYPVGLWGAQDGFVAFENVTIRRTAELDLEVHFDEGESARLPEELEAAAGTRASERLVSRLLGERAGFEDGEALRIENLLIDPESGLVTHYVVETDPEAIIRSARRAVPAQEVKVREDGRIFVSLRSEELSDAQEFDPAFL